MDEGTTTFEQLPPEFRNGEHPHAHKPWALIIVIFVIISFGAFWYYEHTQAPALPQTIKTAPITTTPATESIDSDDLQAAVNIAIPEFSKQF
ncbi:MAG: hypothetical protein KBB91_00650 [Candidatus Pacebacteria bacterium]|nr:hypothetical protein [Candidatus Paceibacterota bacterium]